MFPVGATKNSGCPLVTRNELSVTAPAVGIRRPTRNVCVVRMPVPLSMVTVQVSPSATATFAKDTAPFAGVVAVTGVPAVGSVRTSVTVWPVRQSALFAVTAAMTPVVAVSEPVLLRLNQRPFARASPLVIVRPHAVEFTTTFATVAVHTLPAASLTSADTVCVPFGYATVPLAEPEFTVSVASGVPLAALLRIATGRPSAPVTVTDVGMELMEYVIAVGALMVHVGGSRSMVTLRVADAVALPDSSVQVAATAYVAVPVTE